MFIDEKKRLTDELSELIDNLSLSTIKEILETTWWEARFYEFLPYMMPTDDCTHWQVKSYEPYTIHGFRYFSTEEEAYQYMLKALVVLDMISVEKILGSFINEIAGELYSTEKS